MPKSTKAQRRDSFILTGLVPRATAYAHAAWKRADKIGRAEVLRLVAQAYVDGATVAWAIDDGAPVDPIEAPRTDPSAEVSTHE